MMNMSNIILLLSRQTVIMETTDVTTMVFLMLNSHFIFNLNYHPKVNNMKTTREDHKDTI